MKKCKLQIDVIKYAVFLGILLLVSMRLFFVLLPHSASMSSSITSWEYANCEMASSFVYSDEKSVFINSYGNIQLYIKSEEGEPITIQTDLGEYYTEKIQMLVDIESDDNHPNYERPGIEMSYNPTEKLQDYLTKASCISPEGNQTINLYNYRQSIEIEEKNESSFTISGKSQINIRPRNCKLLVQPSSTEVIPIEWCLIDSNTPIVIELSSLFDKNVYYLTYPKSLENKTEIDLVHVLNMSVRGTGSIYSYYSSKEREINVHNQLIEFSCDSRKLAHPSGFLSAHIDAGNNEILEVDGHVGDNKISGYSILPSFSEWIKDNIYLLPSLILTIFGGAITLAVSNNKKE